MRKTEPSTIPQFSISNIIGANSPSFDVGLLGAFIGAVLSEFVHRSSLFNLPPSPSTSNITSSTTRSHITPTRQQHEQSTADRCPEHPLSSQRDSDEVPKPKSTQEIGRDLAHQISELRASIALLSSSPSLHRFQSAPTVQISPTFSFPSEGIISYLQHRWPGNVEDRGLVHVFADRLDPNSTYLCAKHVTDFSTDSYFESANLPNQSIGFDFKEMRIVPTHYSVRSYHGQANGHHLRSWVVEVSNDGLGHEWHQIDERKDCSELNGCHLEPIFTIAHPPKEELRFIRLRQTGKNWANNDYLIICGFEVFGQLRIPSKPSVDDP